MKYLLLPVLFVCTMMSMSSCKEDDLPIDAPYDINITFIEPGESEIFTSGDELHMEIDFERTGTIHYIDVLAMNETTGDTIYYSGEIHADAENFYSFHEHQDLSIAVLSNCKVVASSWEHDPIDKISEEIHFTVNP